MQKKKMLAWRNVCCDFLLENKQGTGTCTSLLVFFLILPTMPKPPFVCELGFGGEENGRKSLWRGKQSFEGFKKNKEGFWVV